MSPQRFELARWLTGFDANARRLSALAAANPPATRPGWTPAECIDHLAITARAYQALLEQARHAATVRPGVPYNWLGKWFLTSMENPAKARSKTPAPFAPVSNQQLPGVVSSYLNQRQQIHELAVTIATTSRDGIKVTSPFASWLRYQSGYALDLWLAHESRHLTQAEAHKSVKE